MSQINDLNNRILALEVKLKEIERKLKLVEGYETPKEVRIPDRIELPRNDFKDPSPKFPFRN